MTEALTHPLVQAYAPTEQAHLNASALSGEGALPASLLAPHADAPLAPQTELVQKVKRTPKKGIKRHPVHGVFLLDKPLGLSSNQALQKVKWLFQAEKAGHTGTLDPLATGVLPICLGAATKFSQLHLDANKSYWAVARLGELSATGDSEGPLEEGGPCADLDLSVVALKAVAQQFLGQIEQTPPMHSALKVNGRALYDYAREGVSIDRASRTVQIFDLNLCEITAVEELKNFDPSLPKNYASLQATPSKGGDAVTSKETLDAALWDAFFKPGKRLLGIKVHCSKGTYIRTLAQDLGEALGCGAYLLSLRRVQTGPFGQELCTSIEALEGMDPQQKTQTIGPIESLLKDHAPIYLEDEEAARFLSGLRRRGSWPDDPQVAVYAQSPPNNLLGTAHVKAGELIAERLLNPVEINSILESLI